MVNSINYSSDGVSDYMAVIKDCRHLLLTDLLNFDVKFIRTQVNGVAYNLATAIVVQL